VLLSQGGRELVSVAISAVAAVPSSAASTAESAATASAAESAAATTAAAAAVPSTTAAAPAPAATRTLLTRTGFVDGQGPAIVLLAIERRDGCLRFLIAGHFNEPEPLAAAGITIIDDLG
jgi:hypothetical protein